MPIGAYDGESVNVIMSIEISLFNTELGCKANSNYINHASFDDHMRHIQCTFSVDGLMHI